LLSRKVCGCARHPSLAGALARLMRLRHTSRRTRGFWSWSCNKVWKRRWQGPRSSCPTPIPHVNCPLAPYVPGQPRGRSNLLLPLTSRLTRRACHANARPWGLVACPAPMPVSRASAHRYVCTAGGKTGMTASRLPRRTKAAAASTERVSKLLKDQICANYNTILINFNRNDVQNTGKVDSRELLKVMARCNIPMTEHQAGEIVALLDPDDQGRSVMLLDEPASNRSFCSCPRECLRSPPCREAGPPCPSEHARLHPVQNSLPRFFGHFLRANAEPPWREEPADVFSASGERRLTGSVANADALSHVNTCLCNGVLVVV